MVIIDRLSALAALGLASQAGGRLPLHCTGVGKVLLSHGDAELIETVLAAGLHSYSPRTIVAHEALRKEIADCRRTGTATVRGELTPGADSRWPHASLTATAGS